jgi:hypothetical protein
MRKLYALPALAVVSVFALAPAARDAAAETPGAPTVAPPHPQQPPIGQLPYLSHGRHQPFPDGKWNGQHGVVYEFDVHNPGATAWSGVVVLQASSGPVYHAMPEAKKVPVSVPAGGMQTISVHDPMPTYPCLERRYDVLFEGAPSSRMELRTTPSCSFTHKIEEPWRNMDAAQVADAKKDAVYYDHAKLAAPLTCGVDKTVTIASSVVNSSKKPAKGVVLTVVGPGNDSESLGTNAPYDVAPGISNGFSNNHVFSGVPGTYTLRVAEQSGPRVSQPGFAVKVDTSCTLAVSFTKPKYP